MPCCFNNASDALKLLQRWLGTLQVAAFLRQLVWSGGFFFSKFTVEDDIYVESSGSGTQ